MVELDDISKEAANEMSKIKSKRRGSASGLKVLVMWRWHKLMDMHVLTGDGDKLGRQIATVWENGTWSTWDEDGVGLENGVEIGVKEAKAHASLSAINQYLLDT